MAIAGKLAASRVKVEVLESRVLTKEDSNTHLFYAGSSPVTLTIPTEFPKGIEIEVAQIGTGTVTIVPDTGITINGTSDAVELSQNSVVIFNFYTSTSLTVYGGDIFSVPWNKISQVPTRLSTIANQVNPTSVKTIQLNTDGSIGFVDPTTGGDPTDWANPGAIGVTTANIGKFTDLNVSGVIELPSNSFKTTVDTESLTANRTINFPNKTGTVALTSDISALSQPTLTYNASTATLTFTDGLSNSSNIDLPIENLFQNASYNSGTQILTLNTNGGGTIEVSLSSLVDLPEIVIATVDPGVNPTSGQKLYLRSDTGEYWISNGSIWQGKYLSFTSTERTKLSGISTGATANSTDAQLRDRSTHTGVQLWSTISSTPTTLSGYGITDGVVTSDSRLSDARTPLAHNQAWTTITGDRTFLSQGSAPSTPVSGFTLYADSTNRLSWKGTNGFIRTFDGTANTSDRSYTLPDLSGTIALTSQLTGKADLSGATFTGAISGTSLSLSTALPITSGGTGATTASVARTSLGAAASGSNSDITSLSGLTTALSIGQGGTGATSAAAARTALGAASSADPNLTLYKYVGSTVPTGMSVGDRWLETVSNSTLSWYWDGTRWLSTQYLNLGSPSSTGLASGSDRGMAFQVITGTSGLWIESISIWAWSSSTHDASNNFVFTPGYFAYNAANINTSVDWTSISSNGLAGNGSSLTNLGTATINTAIPWTNITGFRLFIARSGSAVINYNSVFRLRHYR